MKNSLNFQRKTKLNNSNSANNKKLWLDDPAFKSNHTLKEYINHKLDTIYNDNNKSQELFKIRSLITNNRRQLSSKLCHSHIKSKSLVKNKIKKNEHYVIFNYAKKSPSKSKRAKDNSSSCFIISTDNYKKELNSTPNNYSSNSRKKSIATYSQINLLKNEINELLNNNKKTKKKQECDLNYPKKNKVKKSINQVLLLENKIQKLLKNDENENKENECPIPMPYVKRYSNEYNIINDRFDETEVFKKDLNEPKPEKIVPLPLPLSLTNSLYNVNSTQNKKLINDKKKYNSRKNKKRK